MNLSEQYFEHLRNLLRKVRELNRPALQSMGPAIAKNLREGGVLHTFGSGHSGILAQELVHRAGGLVPVSALLDPTGGWVETLPGYGTRLVQRHHYAFELRSGEFIIVISNSGINPCPLEVALETKNLGLKVIALTCLEMSRKAVPNHPGGKRLFEIADFVLDNGGAPGDAAIPVPSLPDKVGPTSTLTGALLLNLILMEIVACLSENNLPLPILRSANTPGAREFNAEISRSYKHRLSRPL